MTDLFHMLTILDSILKSSDPKGTVLKHKLDLEKRIKRLEKQIENSD